MPPHKKKYNKEHIILLILIYNLKQTLSISDIEKLFQPLFNGEKFLQLAEIYANFSKIKQDLYGDFSELYADKLELIQKSSNEFSNELKEEDHKRKGEFF